MAGAKFIIRESLVKRTFFQDLLSQFRSKWPQVPEKRAIKACAKYSDAIIQAVHERASIDSIEGLTQICLTDLRRRAGRVNIDQKQAWTLNLFQSLSRPLIRTQIKGNEGYYSKVAIMGYYETELLEEIRDIEFQLSPEAQNQVALLKQQGQVEVYPVVIEPQCIEDYIKATVAEIKTTSKGPAYVKKLNYYAILAKKILDNSYTSDDGRFTLYDDLYIGSDTGRQYGVGLSLQRVPKPVRHAALGVCYKYDFKAAAFSILSSFATMASEAMGDKFVFRNVENYVKNRTEIREMIAQRIGASPKVVKSVFTAIGFGAKMVDNPHKAIKKMLTADQFEKLKEDDFFQAIDTEMFQIREILDAYFDDAFFKEHNYEVWGGKWAPRDANGKKKSKSQKMAWLYQTVEAYSLQILLDTVEKHYSTHPELRAKDIILLKCHDCVYSKYRFNQPLMESIIDNIQTFAFPGIRIDIEQVIPIHTGERAYCKEEVEWDERVKAHEKHIKEEEKLAAMIGQLTGNFEQKFCVSEDDEFYDEIKELNPELFVPSIGTNVYDRYNNLLGIPTAPVREKSQHVEYMRSKYPKLFDPDFDPTKDKFGNELYYRDDDYYDDI